MRKNSRHPYRFSPRPGDLPRAELVRRGIVAAALGWTVHFKVTCERCGRRLMFAEPNTLFTDAECFACNHSTPVRRGGFLLLRTDFETADIRWMNLPDSIRFAPSTAALRDAWQRRVRLIDRVGDELVAAIEDLPQPARDALAMREAAVGWIGDDKDARCWWRQQPHASTDEGKRFDKALASVAEAVHQGTVQCDALRRLGFEPDEAAA